MDILVQKFGGSSLATPAKLQAAAAITCAAARAGRPVIVVVSARANATDELLATAEEVCGTARSGDTAREVDQLLATGESASAALFALALAAGGVRAQSLTAAQAGIRATGRHLAGVISQIDPGPITRVLADGQVAVVAGFQGKTESGDIITLGKGGSDTTAVAVAAVLGARACDIYTDVSGVYTADPRIASSARLIPQIDTKIMTEMAFAGAKVMHSRAVELAALQKIDLHVRNPLTPGQGTTITAATGDVPLESEGDIIAITHDLNVARLLVHARGGQTDLAAEVLAVLAGQSAPVDMVARSGPHESEFRMGFAVRSSDARQIRSLLEQAAARFTVRVDDDVAKISIIGMGLLNRPEYAARMMTALSAAGIPTYWVSSSQFRISAIVSRAQTAAAVVALHRAFTLTRQAGRTGLATV